MFAKDTIKITAIVQNELQKSINEVSDWCDKNAIILHPAKTKIMLLAPRQKRQLRPLILNLNLKDNHIEQVHEHRHLGIIIDCLLYTSPSPRDLGQSRMPSSA